MNCLSKTIEPHPNARLAMDSTLIEKALEHQLTGAIMARLLLRGQRYELLYGVFDRDGYDVVIEAGGIMRHIQLKAVVANGKRNRFSLSTRLASKPSGCAIWISWDPATIGYTGFRFFGGRPGEPLPDLGDRVSRHSRANSLGRKGERLDHREIPASCFTRIADLEALVDHLFGPAPDPDLQLLRTAMISAPGISAEGWIGAVREGSFDAIPTDLDWDGSADLAHLIDGYALLEQTGRGEGATFANQARIIAEQTGRWAGGALDLWIALFLEHRHWRQSEPHEPDPQQRALLDTLVHQLREALVA